MSSFNLARARAELEHGNPSEMMAEVKRRLKAYESSRLSNALMAFVGRRHLRQAHLLAEQVFNVRGRTALHSGEVYLLFCVYARVLQEGSHAKEAIRTHQLIVFDLFKDIGMKYAAELNLRKGTAGTARMYLLAKGMLLELESHGCLDLGPRAFEYAEDIYQFCDKYRGNPENLSAMRIVKALMCHIAGDSPAIAQAKCWLEESEKKKM